MTDRSSEKPASDSDGLVLADLLVDLTEIVHHLGDRLAVREVLDSYLLAAAAVQIVEDHLARDVLVLRRGTGYLREQAAPVALSGVLDRVADFGESVRSSRRGERRTARWRNEAAALRDALARRVITGSAGAGPDEHLSVALRLRGLLPLLPRELCRSVLRIPSCFRSFDQEPADMSALASRFRLRHPNLDRPVLVLGVRTSGSYLAPLVAAALTEIGYHEVVAESARPGYRLRGPLPELLRAVARNGGRVTIVDDPPTTGGAIAEVADAVRRAGVPGSAVTVLLPLFGQTPPGTLAGYDSILLPYREWAIHGRLETEAVVPVLTQLLGRQVARIHRLPQPVTAPGRAHARAVFEVELATGETRRIAATGAGLGFFGRHSIAVARAVASHLPDTYGFAEGLVFRDWLPGEQRMGDSGTRDAADLAGYVRARAVAMPASADRAARLSGRQPVWEAASRVLQRNYGRAGVLLRPVLLDPLVRRLCSVDRPSVVDGATGLNHWYRTSFGLRKVDADVRDFANTDLACYDPVYDLAGIDPGSTDAELLDSLRAVMPCDPERFLLYELVHLWDRQREGVPVHRAGARAVQRYLREIVFSGVQPQDTGALCALDVDGVLESDALGFPMPTPTAAFAVRALLAHGFRAVVATGRSVDEVRERCLAYGLAGGVAEYGSVVYHDGSTEDLVQTTDRAVLDRLRATVRARPGIEVDEDYRHIVRARIRSGGALPDELAAGLLDGCAGRVRVIKGDGQTDFVAAAVNKGAGLGVLARRLRADIAWAIGDSAADRPMLALADTAYVPANGDPELRASGATLLGKPYAAGVAQAVAKLIGHDPGGCADCRPSHLSARSRTLLTLLDASNAGARGLPAAIARGLLRLGAGSI